MAVIANLDVVLAARTEKLDRGFAKGQRSAKSFGKSLNSAGESLSGMTPSLPIIGRLGPMLGKLGPAGMAAGAAIGVFTVALGTAAAGVAFLTSKIKTQLPVIDKLGKMASSIRISVTDLQAIRLAMGESSGLENSASDKAMQTFNRRISEAREGLADASNAMKALGLDAIELGNMPIYEAYKKTADAAGKIENVSQRNLALIRLFGREGGRIAATFADGAARTEEVKDFLEGAGIALSDIDVQQVEDANDKIARVGLLTEGIYNRLTADFAPLITLVANEILDASQNFGGIGNSIRLAVDTTAALYGELKDVFTIMQGITQLATGKGLTGLNTIREGMQFEGAQNALTELQKLRDAAALQAAADTEDTGAFDDSLEDAQKLMEQFAAPSDGLARQMAEIKKLSESGYIDERVASQAARKAAEEFARSVDGVSIGDPDFAISEIQKALNSGLIDDETAKEMLDKIEQLKRVELFGPDAIRMAEQIAEKFKLPEQQFNEEVEQLKQLFDSGLINFDQLTAATREAAEKLEQATNTDDGDEKAAASKQAPGFAAVTAGSVAGYQAALRNQRDGENKNLSELKRMNVMFGEAVPLLEQINNGIAQLPPQRVVG